MEKARNDIALCVNVMFSEGLCDCCYRNPANRQVGDRQVWQQGDYLMKRMGEDECMDYMEKAE